MEIPDKMYKHLHIVAINAVIKKQDEPKILMLKRNIHEIAYPGKWALPGGKAEKGEYVMDVLRREVLEETGLDIETEKHFLYDFTFIRPDDYNVIGFAFLVKAKSEKVKIDKDFDDYKWVDLEEVDKLDCIDPDKIKWILKEIKNLNI